ncbi:unnamed protein product [Pleuronectes platessa]|uniref:Transmembrane protein 71 n=1 Tax=Pleuronectes platessa TaxID=8262 RepID=A0A9N7U717_PLEPL|nr:unnamed protein product [Pleuronectes platessa]
MRRLLRLTNDIITAHDLNFFFSGFSAVDGGLAARWPASSVTSQRAASRGWDREDEQGPTWATSSQQVLLDESSWVGLGSTELEESRSFTYDPTEIPSCPDKVSPPPRLLVQEEICSEICQSKEQFAQSSGGLSEVPPTSALFTNACCCQASPEHTGLTMKTFLLLLFSVFIFSSLYSRCLWWSSTVTSTVFMTITTFMFLTKSGPMGEWRRAKTEDITSRNE